MRIVRPGSVVGPQQQYMYLKQLEWAKWAAVDEVKRTQATVATVAARQTVVTPATPPAESDEEENVNMVTELMTTTTTTTTMTTSLSIPKTPPPAAIPPVTPARHVATTQARAKAISPPGQPRKTPAPKRSSIAVEDSDEEKEEADALPQLGVAPPLRRTRPKPASVQARSVATRVTASEQRPTRVTRSTAAAAANKKSTVGVASTTTTTTKARTLRSGNGQAPNKIPRLANGTAARNNTASTPAATTAAAAVAPTTTTIRRPIRAPPSPVPSRLPTLVPTRRGNHQSATSVQENPATIASIVKGAQTQKADWMTSNASQVVEKSSKSERPGLRPIRRRRSSFSAADVVA